MAERETILIADDAELNRALLRALFERKYNILEAENGAQALMLLRQYSESIAAVLLDLMMPERSGYDVLGDMRLEERLCHIPVVVITAEDSVDSRVRVFELGASDIITKPFDPDVVQSRVKNIIELGRYRRKLESLVAEQSARAQESSAAVVDMLSSVIEYRSLESGQHIRRIRLFTKILLEDVAKYYPEYALDERKIRLITDASSMHDIGKIAIPDSILNKPGRLTAEEFEVIKTHTTKGCEILTGLDRLQDREYLQYAYNICRHHHERWDGSGYPDGLRENSIPICAQVVAVADCYDALTTDRVYKKAIPHGRAFSMILNGECGVFSPRLLECFKNVRSAFAQLSAEYADGRRAPGEGAETPLELPPPPWDSEENMLGQSQIKYFSLLRYTDATVMEVDLNSGGHHLVYLSDPSFAALRTGDDHRQAVRAFLRSGVHPEDREAAEELLNGYEARLFDEGLARQDLRYRVRDRGSGDYFWCEATALRLNTENPRRRKALLLWRRIPAQAPSPDRRPAPLQSAAWMDRLLGGVQKCRNDRHLTLLQANAGLFDLLGYTEGELREEFHNHYAALIYPPDRAGVEAEIGRQRDAGAVLELEYRLVAKDGRIVWVSERCIAVREGGEEVFYSILLDATRSRQAEEALRLSLERHKIIMEQTNDIVFEWDIKRDELYLSSNWEEKYGFAPITRQVRTAIPKASHLHPDDMPAFVALMDTVAAGVSYKELEFRIADAEGRYRWRRVRATTQFDADGTPYKAVGVILDIDSEKQASAELERRAARDMLTGLYNKAFAQERVERVLSEQGPGELSALMILDIDNFKQINDRYGHMFGDAVLTETAAKVAGLFRGADILARIGGDEFMIFMPNVREEAVARQRAAEVTETLRRHLRESVGDMGFSCSIGLTFSAGPGGRYPELFDQADRALYRAKAAGKHRFVQYREGMGHGPVGIAEARGQGAGTRIDSNTPEQWNFSQFISTIFEALYQAPDFPEAVEQILAMVGRTFHVSRVYVFETAADLERCDNTYEWCAEGITPQKDFLQDYPYLIEGRDYRSNFGEDGLFCCHDTGTLPGRERTILEEQGILSTLQCAIQSGGVFQGFLGLDDCAVRRIWTAAQVEGLTFAAKLLGVFLMKHRAQEALANSLANLHSVLDHQEAWLYVLDPETYELRYINRKTARSVPEARLGGTCYGAFYHRDRPCENCALQKARGPGSGSAEVYNPFLGVWVLADAAMVEWEGRRACLVACRDISAYKK